MAESPAKRKSSMSDGDAKVAQAAADKWKQHHKKIPPFVPEGDPAIDDLPYLNDMDNFVGIPEVIALDDFWINDFIRRKEVAMIFFYDPTLPGMLPAREEFRQAAQNTKRPNHGYGAFNCDYYKDACQEMFVFDVSLPHYKLFTQGNYVWGYNANLTAKQIKKFVEKAPLADDPSPLYYPPCPGRDL
ncbi:hypothetical protein BsWGS_17025 [Bradybaena similaris]